MFNEGDRVKVKDDGGISELNIGDYATITSISSDGRIDSVNNLCGYSYCDDWYEKANSSTTITGLSGTTVLTTGMIDSAVKMLKENKLHSMYLPPYQEFKKQEKIMSKITRFVKNLALSEGDKLLRKYGFQDECGDFTSDAREFALIKLCEDKKAAMVAVAQGLEQEEKDSK